MPLRRRPAPPLRRPVLAEAARDALERGRVGDIYGLYLYGPNAAAREGLEAEAHEVR
jgi:hypothetical protein